MPATRTAPPRVTVLLRAARILLVLLLFLVGTDLALRLILGLGDPVLVTPDAACGYILQPGQNVKRFFCRTSTNRYGMRSDPVQDTPPAGTLRLLFLGDSITYGTSRVDQSALFTQILQRELPAMVHRPVEVMNASASAWAIDNELSWLRSRGTLHAGRVLLVLNSGDLGQPRAKIGDVGDDTTLHHPTTALGEIWTRLVAPRLFPGSLKTDAGDVAQNTPAVISANLADLDQFQSLAAAQHAEFAIVYVPFRREIPEPGAHFLGILRTWTVAHHVPLFDLTSAESPYSVDAITLDHGIHFNVRGNRVVATGIEKQWAALLGR